MPFGDKAAIRHLAFDPRHNVYGNILWIKKAGVIGTHKHRGTVVMVCLEGSARYLEYDWVAHPGDFIYETPGLIHTLVSDHPEGVKLFRLAAGRHRVLRRERQVDRDPRRVVVHQPLRDLLPRARHPDQQAALHLSFVKADSGIIGWFEDIGLARPRRRRRQGRQSRRADARGHRRARRASSYAPQAFENFIADARARVAGARAASRRCAPAISTPSTRVRRICARASCAADCRRDVRGARCRAMPRCASAPARPDVAVRSSATTEDAATPVSRACRTPTCG